MFAVEYAALFELINPGLSALDLPVALGGTTNHIRTATLRRVGGWDAWNVTEDADLGLRLARFGARVGALDSETAEEAPNELANWFRQRSRWQKGWMRLVKANYYIKHIKGLQVKKFCKEPSSQRYRNIHPVTHLARDDAADLRRMALSARLQ
jgi:cellulose synthase/poly-beta-1,6-N-acetylglucosamine synthase-like glycosyltransferase